MLRSSDRAEVGVGAGDVLVGVVGEGKVEASPQQGLSLQRRPRKAQCRADVVEGVDLDLAITQATGKAEGAATPLAGTIGVVGEHPELGEVRVRHGEFVALAQWFEGRHRLRTVAFGVLVSPEEPGQSRQPALAAARAGGVALELEQVESAVASGDGLR